MRLDANGLGIERLAVADFGGATLAVKGRIDTRSQSPRGALTVDVDARALDGIVAVLDKFAPRDGGAIAPCGGSGDPDGAARVGFGRVARRRQRRRGRQVQDRRPRRRFRLALQGDAGAASDAFMLDNLAALGAARLKLVGRIDADDGGALLRAGAARRLDRGRQAARAAQSQCQRPARTATWSSMASWWPARSISPPTAWCGCPNGQARPRGSSSRSPTPTCARRDRWRRGGRPISLPTSLTARLGLSDGTVSLTDVAGTVAGTSVAGSLAVGLQQPMRIDGELELGAVDLPAAIAAIIGTPGAERERCELWSSEPFEPRLAGALSGQVAIKSARVALTPKLAARECTRGAELRRPGIGVAGHRRRRWPAAASPAGSCSCVAPTA